METRSHHCPNCSAPLAVPIGRVEVSCEYCGSRLKLLPDESEMAVVRTREEMKYRERVAVRKEILRAKLDQEQADRWRETAGKVAIAALPVVGEVAGQALFGAAMKRGGGCLGCGCFATLAALALLVAAIFGLTQ